MGGDFYTCPFYCHYIVTKQGLEILLQYFHCNKNTSLITSEIFLKSLNKAKKPTKIFYILLYSLQTCQNFLYSFIHLTSC